jgi:hypothetical protein
VTGIFREKKEKSMDEVLFDLVRCPIAAKRVIAVAAVCFRNCFRSARVVVGEPRWNISCWSRVEERWLFTGQQWQLLYA